VPIVIDGTVHGHIVVAQFMAEARAEIDRAVQVMAAACLLVIVVVAAGGYLAMGRALRPLRAVTETARAIEETDLSRRIEVTGTDEVARLARTFNAMVGRLERAFATQQAFLSDVGHELRTPITIVRGHLELMGDDPAERRETVALVVDELDRMSRMVNDLLMLARAERPDFLQLPAASATKLRNDGPVKHEPNACNSTANVAGRLSTRSIDGSLSFETCATVDASLIMTSCHVATPHKPKVEAALR
jgi:two-component system, OmpR family, sensor kinase